VRIAKVNAKKFNRILNAATARVVGTFEDGRAKKNP